MFSTEKMETEETKEDKIGDAASRSEKELANLGSDVSWALAEAAEAMKDADRSKAALLQGQEEILPAEKGGGQTSPTLDSVLGSDGSGNPVTFRDQLKDIDDLIGVFRSADEPEEIGKLFDEWWGKQSDDDKKSGGKAYILARKFQNFEDYISQISNQTARKIVFNLIQELRTENPPSSPPNKEVGEELGVPELVTNGNKEDISGDSDLLPFDEISGAPPVVEDLTAHETEEASEEQSESSSAELEKKKLSVAEKKRERRKNKKNRKKEKSVPVDDSTPKKAVIDEVRDDSKTEKPAETNPGESKPVKPIEINLLPKELNFLERFKRKKKKEDSEEGGPKPAGPEDPEEIRKEEETELKEELAGKSEKKLSPEETLEKDFQDVFGIEKENLEAIEGFGELSLGQRALVLENLKQITLGRICEEAGEAHARDVSFSGFKIKDAVSPDFLKKIWKVVSKNINIARHEKMAAEKMGKGGIEAHKPVLETLVSGMKNGPEALFGENGELEIQYLAIPEDWSEDEKKQAQAFNETASRLARTPYEWGMKFISKKEGAVFKKNEADYKKALEAVMKIKKEKSGEEEKTVLEMLEIEKNVRLNQFLNINPEAEKKLQAMMTNEGVEAAIGEIVTAKGLFMFGGKATRAVSIGLFGAAGAIIAAACIGGFMGRKRALEGLKTKEKTARRGKEERGELLDAIAEKKGGSEDLKGLYKELEEERVFEKKFQDIDEKDFESSTSLAEEREENTLSIEELREKIKAMEKGLGISKIEKRLKSLVKEESFAEAVVLTERIDILLAVIDGEEKPEEEKEKTRKALSTRVKFAVRKLNDGRVNFGKADVRLFNQYEFSKCLSRAVAVVNMEETEEEKEGEVIEENKIITRRRTRKEVEERLERFLDFKNKRIEKADRDFIIKKTIQGAFIGGSLASAAVFVHEAIAAGHGDGSGKDNIFNALEGGRSADQNSNQIIADFEKNYGIDSSDGIDASEKQVIVSAIKENPQHAEFLGAHYANALDAPDVPAVGGGGSTLEQLHKELKLDDGMDRLEAVKANKAIAQALSQHNQALADQIRDAYKPQLEAWEKLEKIPLYANDGFIGVNVDAHGVVKFVGSNGSAQFNDKGELFYTRDGSDAPVSIIKPGDEHWEQLSKEEAAKLVAENKTLTTTTVAPKPTEAPALPADKTNLTAAKTVASGTGAEKPATATAVTARSAEPPAAALSANKMSAGGAALTAENLDLATVGGGEGIGHALQRQLAAKPGEWGFKGDLKNQAAIKSWAGHEAHRISLKHGYVDPDTGKEVRVRDLGPVGKEGNPAYVLEKDASGKISVKEYLDGKPTGGEGSVSEYEYSNDREASAPIKTGGGAPASGAGKTAGTSLPSDENTGKIGAPGNDVPEIKPYAESEAENNPLGKTGSAYVPRHEGATPEDIKAMEAQRDIWEKRRLGLETDETAPARGTGREGVDSGGEEYKHGQVESETHRDKTPELPKTDPDGRPLSLIDKKGEITAKDGAEIKFNYSGREVSSFSSRASVSEQEIKSITKNIERFGDTKAEEYIKAISKLLIQEKKALDILDPNSAEAAFLKEDMKFQIKASGGILQERIFKEELLLSDKKLEDIVKMAEKIPVLESLPKDYFNADHWPDYFNSDKLETTQRHFAQFARNVAGDKSNGLLRSVLKEMFSEVGPAEMPKLIADHKELISDYGNGFEKLKTIEDEETLRFVKTSIVKMLEVAQKFQELPAPPIKTPIFPDNRIWSDPP